MTDRDSLCCFSPSSSLTQCCCESDKPSLRLKAEAQRCVIELRSHTHLNRRIRTSSHSDRQAAGHINGCYVPSCPLTVPAANGERRCCDEAGRPPRYKTLNHHLGPPEQLEHSQPRLGWRDCEEGKQNYTASVLCSFVFLGDIWRLVCSHLGLSWENLSG